MKITRLLEDIAAVKKYYPDIDDATFSMLIALDPTFNPDKDSVGKYGKWILNLYKRDGKIDRQEHLHDVLTRFHAEKNNLKNTDINQFKSVELLDDYLNNEDSYKDLSARQQLRKVQKSVRGVDLGTDAELIFEDDKWEVWIPKTYEASCKLGQGSTWCTASTGSNYYYKSYSDKGPLFINIKKDDNDKWQFHSQTKSYMDKKDHPINLEDFLIANETLLNVYATDANVQGHLKTLAKSLVKRLELIKYYQQEENDTFLMTSSTKDAFKYCKDHVHHVVTKGLRMVPDDMFNNALTIKSIELNEGVLTLGNRSFNSCINLEEIKLPSTIRLVGTSAFQNCAKIKFLELVSENGVVIDDYAFARCNSLGTIVLGNVTSLGVGALQSCEKLIEVEMSGTLREISPNTFIGCPNLTTVTLPQTVSRIHTAAFRGCSAMQSFSATRDLQMISNNVFEGCANLTVVDFEGSYPYAIGSKAFASCPWLTRIQIPATVEVMGNMVFDGNTTEVTIEKKGPHWKPDWNKGNKGSVKNV